MKRFFAILFFLLTTAPSWGGVSFDTATTQTGTSSSGLSQTHVSAGDLLVCGILTWETFTSKSAAVTAFTYNGVALTHKQQLDHVSNLSTLDIWFLIAPDAGSHTWSFTLSGGTFDAITAGCVSLSGTDQTTPLGTAVTNDNGFSNTITIPANGLGLDFGGDAAGACATGHTVSGTGQTERFEDCADAGAGTTTPLFSSTSSNSGSTGMDWASALAEPVSIAIPVSAATASRTRRPILPVFFQ